MRLKSRPPRGRGCRRADHDGPPYLLPEITASAGTFRTPGGERARAGAADFRNTAIRAAASARRLPAYVVTVLRTGVTCMIERSRRKRMYAAPFRTPCTSLLVQAASRPRR